LYIYFIFYFKEWTFTSYYLKIRSFIFISDTLKLP